MSDSEPPRAIAIWAVEYLKSRKETPQDGLDGTLEYLKAGHKQRGRPKGKGIDDSAQLRRMRTLIQMRDAKNPHDAARQVTANLPDHVRSTARHRLCRKYRATNTALEDGPSDKDDIVHNDLAKRSVDK